MPPLEEEILVTLPSTPEGGVGSIVMSMSV